MGQDFLDEQYIRSGTAGYPASIHVYQEELTNITMNYKLVFKHTSI